MQHDFRYPTIIKHGTKYDIYISIGHPHSGTTIYINNADLPITKSECLTNYISIIEEELIVHNFTVFKDKYLKKYYGIGGQIRNQPPFNDFKRNNGIFLFTFLNNKWIKINNNKPIISINNLPKNAIISIEKKAPEFDSNIVCFYSLILKKYVLFCRANIARNHRGTQMITSSNLIEWSPFSLLKINTFVRGQNNYMFKCIEIFEEKILFALTPFTHNLKENCVKKLISFDFTNWIDIGKLCNGELASDEKHLNIHIGEIFYENKILEIILLNKPYTDNPEIQLYKFNYNDFLISHKTSFIDFLKSISILGDI